MPYDMSLIDTPAAPVLANHIGAIKLKCRTAVPKEGYSSTRTALVASVLDKGSEILGVQFGGRDGVDSIAEGCAA